MAKLSPEEIAKLEAHYERLKGQLRTLAPEAFPSTPDDPTNFDLWSGPEGKLSGGRKRAAASFGNDAGVAEQLKKIGYKAVQKNAKGELVAQGPTGTWYRDQPDDFFKGLGFSDQIKDHPFDTIARKAENNLGAALPGIGMLGGAAAGIPADIATANPMASVVGAGGGMAAGQGARDVIGDMLGYYKPKDLMEPVADMAGAASEGMGAELGGKALHGLLGKPVDYLTKKVMDLGRGTLATLSSAASGVPREHVSRLLQSPWKVMNPPSNATIGAAVDAEMPKTYADASNKMLEGRKDLVTNHGDTLRDTTAPIDVIRSTMARTPVASDGTSLLPPEQRQGMEEFIRNKLSTAKTGQPTMAPGAVASRMEFGAPEVVQPAVQYTPVETQHSLGGPYNSQKVPKIVPSGKAETVAPPVYASPWKGTYTNHMPERRAGDLLPYADVIGADIGSGFDASIARRTPLPDQVDMQVRGAIKDDLHKLSSPLAEGDALFHQTKQDRKLLTGYAKEGSQEATAGNVTVGNNKTAQREALARQAPNTYKTLQLDRDANEAFTEGSPLKGFLPPMARGGVLGTLAGLGAERYGSQGALGMAEAAAAALALSSPRMHYYTLGNASKLAGPFARAVRQNGLRVPLDAFAATHQVSPWSLFNKQENQ